MTMGITILETPVKSEGDKKDYRLIKLSNGIKVLLINDDSGHNLAVALAVRVGSFDDPPHAMGLAHFLEHVVFKGSEKYPVENSFDNFVNANGGFNNATTKSESTIYFFHVSKHISQALDMFADKFRAPLLTKDSMRRERESVDSEFHQLDSSDDDHLGFILKTLINGNHPASQFNFGNLKTLKDNIEDDELHKELVKLHSKYVGKKMYLAVQSNRSLDDLQEMVMERFSPIKAGDDEEEKPTVKIEEIFKPEFYSKIFYMKPKLARKTLHVTWTLPSLRKHYKTRPLSYIFTDIFPNEGEGGLQSFLKNHNLISMMSSFPEFSGNSSFRMPNLQFYLTDYGFANINKILEALFSYLLMLKETPLSEHRRLYTELSEMEAVGFKFHQESLLESLSIQNEDSYVSSMMFVDDSDILRVSSQKLLFFEENIIKQVLELLNERKFNITIMNDEHRSFNKIEKYFGTEYEEKDFPEEYQKLWDERKLNPEFYLEKSNPFRPTNFEIFVNKDESPIYPAKIFEDNVFEAWHRLDDNFKTPRAIVNINLLSPKQMTSIQSFVYLTLYNSLANRHLMKSLSQPLRAGLTFYVTGKEKAFIINLSGYNDKMEAFAELFMTELKNFHESMDQSSFELEKTRIKERYFNTLLESDFLANEYFQKCIRNEFYTDLELFNEINNATLENLRKFVEKFYQKMKIQILVQGNMTKTQALRIVNIVQSHLPCEALDDEYELKCRNYQMPLGSSVLRMKSLQKNNRNSAIKNYYQTGKRTLRSSNLVRLVASILNTRAFDFLRYKEQLGYAVSCSYYQSEGGYLGLTVDVEFQESKHTFKEVYEKMVFFMTNIAKRTIEELTDEEFESFKDVRVKYLLGEHEKISDEVKQNWNKITDQDYIFNLDDLSAKMLKTLTKSDVQEFFYSFTKQENLRLLSVQVVGHMDNNQDELDIKSVGKIDLQISTDKIAEDENLISDIESFHENIVLYPMTKFEVE